MADKVIKGYVQQKHDTAAHWATSSLIPAAGQIVVYDDGEGGQAAPKMKIGDGVTIVKNLPFSSLPKVNSTDAGLFLRVNAQGQWDKMAVPNAENNTF